MKLRVLGKTVSLLKRRGKQFFGSCGEVRRCTHRAVYVRCDRYGTYIEGFRRAKAELAYKTARWMPWGPLEGDSTWAWVLLFDNADNE